MPVATVADVSVAEVAADPATLDIERLELQLRSHATHINAAMARFLALVGEYDRRGLYASRWECVSAAHWLAQHCALAIGTAREYVRVARALAELPRIATAFGRGKLSYSKVRALTRVATAASESELLALGLVMSATQLQTTMALIERCARNFTTAELGRIEAARGAERWANDDGTVTWRLTMSCEEDATLALAIEAARDRDFGAARAEVGPKGKVGPERGARLSRLEAVVQAVEAGLSASALSTAELPERYRLVINLEGDPADPQGSASLPGGIRLHPDVARRLGCDAELALAWEGPGGLVLGRTVRTFTRRQRRVIAARHATCAFPTCEVPSRRCQFHHLVHWTKGGPTDVDNGRPLCRHHHRAVHEGGWRLGGDAGGRINALAPDGRRLSHVPEAVEAPPADNGAALVALAEELGLDLARTVADAQQPEHGSIRYAVDVYASKWEYGHFDIRGYPPPTLN